MNKLTNIIFILELQKQHSPGSQSGRNLRVVIPTQMTTGISSDDISYSEVELILFLVTMRYFLLKKKKKA